MQIKIQYNNTDEEKQNIINNNADKILIEEHHLFDGDFLIFSDIKPLAYQIQDIQNNTDLILLKQEGII